MLEASHSSQAAEEGKKRACDSGVTGVVGNFLVWPGGPDGDAEGERVGAAVYGGLMGVATSSMSLGFCFSSDGFAYGLLSSGFVEDRSWRGIVKDIGERVVARPTESTVSEADEAKFIKINTMKQQLIRSHMIHA